MTIRKRLTYIFTIIVVGILVLFSLAIYYFSSDYRENEFYLRLKNKAITTARLLTETKGIDYALLKAIDKNTVNALYQQEVSIYDSLNTEIYNNTDKKYYSSPPIKLLDKIRSDGEVRFRKDEKEAIGIIYTDKNNRFVVIASAVDEYGFNGLEDLMTILIIGLVITIIITFFAGLIFSGKALEPISNVVKQVEAISISNLNLRVDEGNGTDEIAQLAIKFNKMLERLEAAFEMQRNFVSNSSHELRTPLTAIGGQIEIALMSKREAGEYESILQSIWDDIKNLNKLSNGLLDLAQASLDVSRIKLKNIRIDELLWQSRDELLKRQKDYSITIEYIELPEDEKKMIVRGSENLLKTAITNVMDNACKYSQDKKVIVNINFDDRSVFLQFVDKGIGIPEQDLAQVFESFYRASNARGFSGHGIGLSLTKKIIDLHKGTIKISSIPGKGTIVLISLPLEN
jgi:signal transduction histidine kinase